MSVTKSTSEEVEIDWEALRWRELTWSTLPHTTRKGLVPFLSAESCRSLDSALTNSEARPHLVKSYKGMVSPGFNEYLYTDKKDYRSLRWVMKKGVDLQGFRLKMKDEMGSGTILARLMGYVGENEEDQQEAVARAQKNRLISGQLYRLTIEVANPQSVAPAVF